MHAASARTTATTAPRANKNVSERRARRGAHARRAAAREVRERRDATRAAGAWGRGRGATRDGGARERARAMDDEGRACDGRRLRVAERRRARRWIARAASGEGWISEMTTDDDVALGAGRRRRGRAATDATTGERGRLTVMIGFVNA